MIYFISILLKYNFLFKLIKYDCNNLCNNKSVHKVIIINHL